MIPQHNRSPSDRRRETHTPSDTALPLRCSTHTTPASTRGTTTAGLTDSWDSASKARLLDDAMWFRR
ncbi:MAG TPA: hypothetical protein VG797_11795 [Phycisphaerales bacterium]|nr:hypothetical protein [Phycisphaerales bacterium]